MAGGGQGTEKTKLPLPGLRGRPEREGGLRKLRTPAAKKAEKKNVILDPPREKTARKRREAGAAHAFQGGGDGAKLQGKKKNTRSDEL